MQYPPTYCLTESASKFFKKQFILNLKISQKPLNREEFRLGSDTLKIHSKLFLIPRNRSSNDSRLDLHFKPHYNAINSSNPFKKTPRRRIRLWWPWQHSGARLLPGLRARWRCAFRHRRRLAIRRSLSRTSRNELKECCGPRIWSFAWVGPFVGARRGNVPVVPRISRRRRLTWRWQDSDSRNLWCKGRRTTMGTQLEFKSAAADHKTDNDPTHNDNDQTLQYSSILPWPATKRIQRKTQQFWHKLPSKVSRKTTLLSIGPHEIINNDRAHNALSSSQQTSPKTRHMQHVIRRHHNDPGRDFHFQGAVFVAHRCRWSARRVSAWNHENVERTAAFAYSCRHRLRE